MSFARCFRFVLFPILLVAFVGCASTPTQEGTGEYFDDSVITAKVKTALFHEASLKSFDIKVQTFKGKVQLSGFVNTQADIDKAVEIAHNVKGVVEVRNSLQLK